MADRVEELEQEQEQLKDQVEEAGQQAAVAAAKEGLSEEQVNERIQKARKEEKDKLYPQLEELRTAQKEMQEILKAEREEKETIRRQHDEEAEQKRVAKLSESQRTQELLNKLEEQLREEREARDRFRQELETSRREEALRLYKERAIASAGSEIITGLVGGNSETEIDRSVALAKSEWKKIYEAAKQQASQQVRRDLTSANPDLEAFDEEELQSQLQIDPERYMKDAVYREQMKSRVANAYQSGARK